MANRAQQNTDPDTEDEKVETAPTVEDLWADDDVDLALPVGSDVWYSLRPDGEYVPAKVIDKIEDSSLDSPLEPNMLHLLVKLNRKRHYSSGTRGYRLNVPHGAGLGQWLKDKPEGADAAYQAKKEREVLLVQARKEQMRA